MSVWLRRFGTGALAGLAALALLSDSASAQFIRPGGRMPSLVGLQSQLLFNRPNTNFYFADGTSLKQLAYNTAVLGTAASFIPPYLLGYNPYPPMVNYGPSYPTAGPYNPYALSTTPYAPGLSGGYGGIGGYGSASATSLYGGYGGYGTYTTGGGGYGGTGGSSPSAYGSPDPNAAYLRGLADVTGATGRYHLTIQQASLAREKARQAQVDARRRLLEYERQAERNRPTYLTVLDRERAADLSLARQEAPGGTVWSGRALNTLLDSVAKSGRPLSDGPNIGLDRATLKHINLTDTATQGNIGLLKSGGNLEWPEPLLASRFDAERKRLHKNMRLAVQQLKDRDPLERSTLNDIRADMKALTDRLNGSVGELSPSQYIQAKRFLNQLSDAVRALADPKVARYFDGTWVARGKNVAELVDYLKKEGLKFAPATPGDEASYNSLYQAMRAFDAGLQVASK
jgi:hypothetical protein